MRPDDLDAPLAFLSDALDALEELPHALSDEQGSQFTSLQSRLKALITSTELFQRRLNTGRCVHRARPMAAPVEELGSDF